MELPKSHNSAESTQRGRLDRILIAGTNSGCGKTTVVCAVLQALTARGLNVASFKCGPDYIDPMFHKKAIGARSYNLDSFFCDENTLKYILCESRADISVIEGVMGFYDGAGEKGSAFSVSQITDSPVIIVIDCKGMSDSIGAVMKGFMEYRKPNNIIGFIFNRLPERLSGFAEELCGKLGTEYLGFFPECEVRLESRRLGLVAADEIEDLKSKLKRLGELAESHLKMERIIELSKREAPIFEAVEIPGIVCSKPPKIAVATDNAFCFLYSENIDLLKKLGCEIVPFSPLRDKGLPDDCSGLILCGGYPELYARELSENVEMLCGIREKILSGMPTVAECGGFMYLHRSLEDENGNEFPMAGVLDGKALKTDSLRRFGYAVLTAKRDNLLCGAGESFPAHEFHYWDSTCRGGDFSARKADGRSWECVIANENLYAGFPHLYFYSNIEAAGNFVKKCVEYGESNEKNL